MSEEIIKNIDISMIDEFPDHPFKVIENDGLKELSESIKEKGILVPLIVREKEDGRYEMLSGHRRMKASELANVKSVPCIVKNVNDIEATIIMIDSNLQREEILPSEKAFAYKMKLEALSHQGKKIDIEPTSDQAGGKYNETAYMIGQINDDSISQVRRYIRLTNLIPELLDMVDEKKIAFNPAVEISYLTEDEQYILLDCIEYNDATPSHAQAIQLKKLSQNVGLDEDIIDDILSQEKPNQIPKLKFNEERIRNVLPKNIQNENIENFIIKAVEHYTNYLKNKGREER